MAAPCYEPFLQRACSLGVAHACATEKLCHPAPSPGGASPGRDVAEAFLKARSAQEADLLLDRALVRRSAALGVLADPGVIDPSGFGVDPARIEEIVEMSLSSTDDDAFTPRRDCSARPGTRADRDFLAPVLYVAAASERMRALVVETRARLDGAEPVVIACRCLPEELLLVDAARRKILAHRFREPPPRVLRISDPREQGPPIAIEIAADAARATLQWRGRDEPLPRRLEAGAHEVVTGTVTAPGREPYEFARRPVAQGALRVWRGEASWFVVLRPVPRAGGAAR